MLVLPGPHRPRLPPPGSDLPGLHAGHQGPQRAAGGGRSVRGVLPPGASLPSPACVAARPRPAPTPGCRAGPPPPGLRFRKRRPAPTAWGTRGWWAAPPTWAVRCCASRTLVSPRLLVAGRGWLFNTQHHIPPSNYSLDKKMSAKNERER